MEFKRDYSSMVILSRLFWIVGGLYIVFRGYYTVWQYNYLLDTLNTNMTGVLDVMSGQPTITMLITQLLAVFGFGIVIIALGFAMQALREITLNSRWQAEIADEMTANSIKQLELLEKLAEK